MPDLQTEIFEAEQRIRPYVRETPLEFSPRLSELSGANVYLKLENFQHTGSFKVRGALNKLLSLTPEQRAQGVVAASSGNHGIAVAYGASLLKTRATIFVPEHVSATKADAIKSHGAEVRLFGSDCVEAENYARAFGLDQGLAYISPYNDRAVIAGQGTIGLELSRQLEAIDAVFIAVGGGGLLAGIGGYLKAGDGQAQLIACSPERSSVMHASLDAGRILTDAESFETLSDGTAGGIEADAITFDYCRELIDDFELVSEDEIKSALLLFMETHHHLIEGAAGVALAAFLKRKENLQDRNVVIVICGGNIGLQTLREVLG